MEADQVELARAEMKLTFEETIRVLQTGSKRATDLLTSVSAWLASSFVALNAAAIPLILSYSERTAYPRTALVLAVLGLATALGAAILICAHLSNAGDAYSKVVANIKSVDVDGPLINMKKIDTAPTEILERTGRTVAIALLAPPLLFLASVSTFGFGFEFVDGDNLNRCAALQADMLAARPRRDDAPDLFQALGCKPRGHGSVFAPPRQTGNRTKPKQ